MSEQKAIEERIHHVLSGDALKNALGLSRFCGPAACRPNFMKVVMGGL